MSSLKIGHLVAPDMSSEANCYDWYEKMRNYYPIHYDKKRKCWDIFRYKDAKEILVNYKSFSSNRSEIQVDSIISMDPPEHTRFRSIANKDFGHRYSQKMESLIVEITNKTFKRIEESEQVDFIHEVAFPIPIMMMMRILGISDHHYEQIKEWSIHTLSRSYSTGRPLKIALKKAINAFQGGNVLFEQLISEKLENPQNDMISDLLSSHGKVIDILKIRDFCRSLLSAGNETSANLIGNAMYLFLKEPGIIDPLQKNPSLIPNAIEEVLRYYPSVHCINRIATENATIGGYNIFAGEEVVVWLASANRDEAIFNQPNKFIIDRQPNPHLTFGHGIHYCLGNVLARLEAKIVLTEFLQRFRKIKLVKEPVPNTNFVFQGFEHIYLSFE